MWGASYLFMRHAVPYFGPVLMIAGCAIILTGCSLILGLVRWPARTVAPAQAGAQSGFPPPRE